MATLTVTEDTDFRGGAAELNITDIVFQTTDEADATFEPGQFGAGLIENDVTLTGDAEVNNVHVLFDAAATFSAAGWEFVSWSDSDGILIRGSSGADTITGSSRNDVILGNGGADDIDAGPGDDTIQILNPNLVAGLAIAGGSDVTFDTIELTALVAQTYDLSGIDIAGIERLSFFNAHTAILDGDQVRLGAIERISGEVGGANALIVRGDDVDLTGVQFFGWDADDTVAIEGTSTISNALVGSNQGETIAGSSNSADTMTGRGGADTLTGGGGSDTFRYMAGTDVAAGETISGGGNPDTISLENGGAISFTGVSIADVEILSFSSGNSTATLASNQVIAGEIAIVSGSAGTDRLVIATVGQLADLSGVGIVDWTNGTDQITVNGSGLADVIIGSTMADLLVGNAGADAMSGGLGDDTYMVEHAGDNAVEGAGGGADQVQSSVTFALADNVEDLTLTGVAPINGFGNVGANTIIGNSAANTLLGYGANDTLTGFGGNDRLDGGAGADAMSGGNGNDTYVVENAGDTASEASGTGTDVVQSVVTFTLAAGIEDLILNGAAAINGTGNAGANSISGNSAANSLSGLAGNDTLTAYGGNDRLDGGANADAMAGGNGNDTYVVDNVGDTASEASGSGIDVVQSTVTFTLASGIENLVLNGTSAINGTGNASANTMSGNSAINRLDGNAGNDTMTGFGAADVFVFDDGDGADTVTDFQDGSDRCDLTAVAGVDAFSDLTVIDNGATVTVDYGTGSFTFANIANPALIDASDFVFA